MCKYAYTILRAAVLAVAVAVSAGAVSVCAVEPPNVSEATVESIESFIREKQMKVLTFAGFSGAQYEDAEAMLKHAAKVLDAQDPAKTMINIGATEVGIGAVYELAKRKGFTTLGIVSSLARDEKVELSKHVDRVFYVKDTSWGGKIPGTDQLSPTSAAIVKCSDSFVAIGGGEVARDELLAVRATGKPVTFVAAEMNHKIAREKARKNGQPEPTDFQGPVHTALEREKK